MTPEALRAHLFQELLPLWDTHGWDASHGGFHSRLSHTLRPVPATYKRTLVQARQLYAFSTAALEGAGRWASERAHQTFDVFQTRCWDARSGGWIFTLTPEGQPLDCSKDTYVHAFALLALAAYARASGERAALARAGETLDLLEQHLADREHGGFFERATAAWEPDRSARRQNPHMHLLEGVLAMHAVSGETRYHEQARALVDLLEHRLFDASHRCLREHFETDWTPATGDAGHCIEPGHHFEWVWLLHCTAELFGGDPRPRLLADALYQFAHRHGIDPDDGAVFDQVDPSGRVRVSQKRVWPQTEYIKALAVRAEHMGEESARIEMRRALELCFERYVDSAHRGWHEHVDRKGTRISEHMNATTVYHVLIALQEAARVLAHPFVA